MTKTLLSIFGLILCAIAGVPPVWADGGVTFRDIAHSGVGLEYRRAESPRDDILDAIKARGVIDFPGIPATPLKAHGEPGVAALDYDNDGDLDLYVTNGPGRPNSLFANQLAQSGHVTFVDVAEAAGVTATEQDSAGVCYGDIDNDGDKDLYVLGSGSPSRLFENQGDGTFRDISASSNTGGTPGTGSYPSSCSMGDVNNDGLLDIVVANTATSWNDRFFLIVQPFEGAAANQLYLNIGANAFVDLSASSGIQELGGLPPGEQRTITWGIAMVDYDLDGDLDILHVDDQGGIPPRDAGGVNYGFIHVLRNDGTGHFTDVTEEAGVANKFGGWMGITLDDFNFDGHLDFFATNAGDWVFTTTPFPYHVGLLASRWFLGNADGTFSDPGVGDQLVATPWGWGTSSADYDNDGDTDIIYHGGIDFGVIVDRSNQGVILQNDGTGNFRDDSAAILTDHSRRSVHGMAVGDFDDNGFYDIVTVADQRVPEAIPLVHYDVPYGSPYDAIVSYAPVWLPTGRPLEFVYGGIDVEEGDLTLELNSGGNGNGWIKVEAVGGKGLAARGTVNRDGIGATFFFTPDGGKTVIRPVVGGSSHCSQDSLEIGAGLGTAASGTLEVQWPGGVRNRLHGVRSGERITFPEIPCSFTTGEKKSKYRTCVLDALHSYAQGGVLTQMERKRFLDSALRAYDEAHR